MHIFFLERAPERWSGEVIQAEELVKIALSTIAPTVDDALFFGGRSFGAIFPMIYIQKTYKQIQQNCTVGLINCVSIIC